MKNELRRCGNFAACFVSIKRVGVKLFKATLLALMLVSTSATAATYYFPSPKSTIVTSDPPRWLKDGRGNDGYLSIVSEVIPATTCIPLSDNNFWSKEKTQLVLSVTSSGFLRERDVNEIPIATFDGRNDGSECASLSTMPISIVPMTLLGGFSSLNPGKLSLMLNVKSSSDSTQDYIGPVKLALGAATLVATGGAANIVGGVAATVGNPVFSEVQSRTNTLLKGMASTKTTQQLTWRKIRSGLSTIEIPVYKGEGDIKNIDLSGGDASENWRNSSKLTKSLLFTVRFSFSYTNSIFDSMMAHNRDIGGESTLSTSSVLNSRAMNTPFNFLQYLNDSEPSLLLAINSSHGRMLTNACDIGLEKLRNLGLSNMDIAIALKSFIDEAKGGSDWYANPQSVKECFGQAPAVQDQLEAVYGPPTPKFVIGDVQDGTGRMYSSWRDTVGPTLDGLRKVLAYSRGQREALIAYNRKKDIGLLFSPEVPPWGETGVSSDYPGIDSLIGKGIKSIGCFAYRDVTNFQSEERSAYLLLKDAEGLFWLGLARMPEISEASPRIATLTISSLTPDWLAYFASLRFPGGTCDLMLAEATKK